MKNLQNFLLKLSKIVNFDCFLKKIENFTGVSGCSAPLPDPPSRRPPYKPSLDGPPFQRALMNIFYLNHVEKLQFWKKCMRKKNNSEICKIISNYSSEFIFNQFSLDHSPNLSTVEGLAIWAGRSTRVQGVFWGDGLVVIKSVGRVETQWLS